MLAEFTAWLSSLVVGWFTALWDFVVDAAIGLFDLLLQAVGALLAAIPLPAFLTDGLGSLWNALPPGMVWLLSQAGVPAAFAMLGTGFAFRLLRKVFTLFQW